jgi:hypothetical protein
MRQVDVLFTVWGVIDGMLADVFNLICEELGAQDFGSRRGSVMSSEDRVLALSDSCDLRTAGTGWRLDEALEDVMEVLEVTAVFLRRGVGRGRAKEAASSASCVVYGKRRYSVCSGVRTLC